MARFYAANIALALNYLHSINVLYRDLKPENILVCQDGYLKIADFGLSKIIHDRNQCDMRVCGTPDYMPPEVLTGQGYSMSSDWWSFGCLIYELLVGLPPFYSDDQNACNK